MNDCGFVFEVLVAPYGGLYDAPAAVFVETCAADEPKLFLAAVYSVMLAAS